MRLQAKKKQKKRKLQQLNYEGVSVHQGDGREKGSIIYENLNVFPIHEDVQTR